MARRYSTALFELTEEAKATDIVLSDLTAFAKLISGNGELMKFVKSPVVAIEEQLNVVKEVSAKTALNALTSNFLALVTKNARLNAIEEIVLAFEQQVAQARGEVVAQVVTATELGQAQSAELTQTLEKSLGKKVQLDLNVDPAILGGLIVRVGSKMIDTSIRTKLENLKIAMREVG